MIEELRQLIIFSKFDDSTIPMVHRKQRKIFPLKNINSKKLTFLNIIELILVCLKLMELESTYFFCLKNFSVLKTFSNNIWEIAITWVNMELFYSLLDHPQKSFSVCGSDSETQIFGISLSVLQLGSTDCWLQDAPQTFFNKISNLSKLF